MIRETLTERYSQVWEEEDLEAGECSRESTLREYASFTLRQLIQKIDWGGYSASQSHLMQCRDLSRVWLMRSDQCFRTGDITEETLHLFSEATPRQRRIWAWALRHLAKRRKL